MTWDVLLVLLSPPRKTLRLAGREHGRAIPLADLCAAAEAPLFDHVVGVREQRRRHLKADRLCDHLVGDRHLTRPVGLDHYES